MLKKELRQRIMFKKGLRRRVMLVTTVIILFLAAGSMGFSYWQNINQANEEMHERAVVITKEFVAMRKFIAESQDKINNDSNTKSFEFKHLNPAAVGKTVGQYFGVSSGYQLKQTRIRYRAPDNKPDQYEIDEMMKMPQKKPAEVSPTFKTVSEDGTKVYRYMYPLYFEQPCLACHGEPKGEMDISGHPKEGGKEGEFAGAISVKVPAQAVLDGVTQKTITQGLFFLVIVILILFALNWTLGRLVIKPLKALTQDVDRIGDRSWGDSQADTYNNFEEMHQLGLAFNTMSSKLQSSYDNLEEQVEVRTQMLREANEQLRVKGQELQYINSLLSDSDRQKSELMAAISNELSQPLNAIISFTQNALEHSQNQGQVKYLSEILGNAQMLDDQISDLLAMSQIEAGLMGLDYTEFKFEDILEDLRKMVDPVVERKLLNFSINIDETTTSVVADESKIVHVLRNLLSNAIKYTPEGGWVRLDIGPQPEAKDEKQQDMISIRISDSGIGIKTEDLPNVFTRMWRSGEEASRGLTNHGLGLAIAKIFVELHGGSVDIKSIWQKGTLVTITMPRSPEY